MAYKHPFDWSDVSDLPEEKRKGLGQKQAQTTITNDLLKLIKLAHDNGVMRVTVSMIDAAAHREKVKLPSKQTITKHLTDAVKAGQLTKPTMQTYALADEK